MLFKKYKWQLVTPTADIDKITTDDNIASVEVEGKKVCLTRFQGKWYAFAHSCPHAGGLMDEGYQDGEGNVVCPIHHYAFSLKNGYNTSGEGFKLKTYPVEVRPEGLFIGLDVPGLFGR